MLPEEGMMNDFSNIMNEMALAVFQTAFMYIAFPVIIVLIIGGFVLRIKWRFLQLLVLPTALIGLYFFATNGLPNMHEAYLIKINN